MANAIGQLHAGFPQNQVTALFGVSTSIFSKLREMGCKVGVPVRQHKKTVSSFCQHVGTKGSLLHVCSQGLQDDMADDSTQTSQVRLHTARLWSHKAARIALHH